VHVEAVGIAGEFIITVGLRGATAVTTHPLLNRHPAYGNSHITANHNSVAYGRSNRNRTSNCTAN
jgi:hypothetical protein